ncbi:MAG TPA: XRE family transcriptional regulator [Planctomycetaceae bacterium]|nr:XRE family transcriptional regulator [Planctomycetaceae bacterium]
MPQSLHPLGSAIKKQREKLGLSQEKLAERCGFDRTYISMLERGRRNPSLLNLLKLAEGLETSVSVLTEVYNGTRTNQSRARSANTSRNSRA